VRRLDLTAASVAYLLEPQWNPMMEEQALSRIHRLGQKKEVKTIRYLILGSFEEVSENCLSIVIFPIEVSP
jgi:SWI/SNF-related matrix-associated actin-dependent regulator of chromatin subfamily A3